MDFSTYFSDIESETVEDRKGVLYFCAFLAAFAAGLHWHASNFINCTVDAVYAALMIMFMWRPNLLTLTGMMTLSLTLCCSSCILLGTGIFYEQLIWSKELCKNTQLMAYILDILFTVAIFWILNTAWETPARDHVVDINEAYHYEHDHIWAPFAGAGKVIGDYNIVVPDMEKQEKAAK